MADTVKKLEAVSARDENYYIAEARFKGEVRRRTDLAYEREEGRAEGREEGRASELTEAVLTVLQVRFGSVPPAVRSFIEAADVPTRRALLARAASVTLLEEFLGG